MKKSTVKLPSLLWYGNTGLELEFPEEWRIHVCSMPGAIHPALNREEIKGALSRPIGSKKISSLAAEREEAVIIFDDMTRPTRAYEIVPFVLDELRKGGIGDDHIRFVDALGCHGADDRSDFAKKLGEEVVEQYPVYNHNPFYGLTDLGITSRGTPVKVNSEVMDCDLKIGVGCVVPHGMSGYGGGGKIILPGVTSYETTYHNHGFVFKSSPESPKNHPSTGWGKVDENVMRLDVEETAKLAQLDIKVDALINGRGESIALFAGDFVKEHREAVKMGRGVYETKPLVEADIVISNTYAKANEAGIGLSMATASVRAGGTVVLVVNTPESLITHYIYGKFGKKRGGGLYSEGRRRLSEDVGKLIVFSPYKVSDPFLSWGPIGSYTWIKTWPEVVEELKTLHDGDARVAVYPNAEIQYPPPT
jgi:nickel-dependent lactate racemase